MEIKPYKSGDYKILLADIRRHDVEEIEALGITPEKGIKESISNSNVLGVVWDEDKMICIFGVTPCGVLSDKGIAWVVGTNNIKARHVIKCMKSISEVMLARYKVLTNFVYTKNRPAIRTLKHAGFTFFPAIKLGPKKENFYRFELRG